MKKKRLLVAAIIGIATLFLAAGLYAGSTMPDVIKMKDDYKHKKGIVEFSHKKHVDEYKATCGDCHHDENNKPLTNLKEGDDVKKCIECHNKPGEKPKGKNAPKLSKKEELQYHAEALHENCKGCHKAYNKKNKTKAAPTTCTKCHPKKKK
jgi:cytochrome c553